VALPKHLDLSENFTGWFSTVSVINQFFDGTLVNTGYSMLRQHPVGDCGVDFLWPHVPYNCSATLTSVPPEMVKHRPMTAVFSLTSP